MLFSSNYIKIGRMHDQSNKLITSSNVNNIENARIIKTNDEEESVFEESLEIKMNERNHYLNDISKLLSEPVSPLIILDIFTFRTMLNKSLVYLHCTHLLGN